MRSPFRSRLTRAALLPAAAGALLIGVAVVGPGADTASAHYNCRSTYLDVGARGNCVWHLQRELNLRAPGMGMLPTRTDGIYGPYTAKLVVRYKSRSGLGHRTLVGPTTWDRLTCYGQSWAAGEVTTDSGARDSIQLVGC